MTGNFKLLIDGQEVRVAEGTTVLEAIRQAGISIPTLCYHPYLKPVGSCRLCVVDIEGDRGLPASCTTPGRRRDGGPHANAAGTRVSPGNAADHPQGLPAGRADSGIAGTDPPSGHRAARPAVERTRSKRTPRWSVFRTGLPLLHSLRPLRAHLPRRSAALRPSSSARASTAWKWGRLSTARWKKSGCQFCAACVDVCPTAALHDLADAGQRRPTKAPPRKSPASARIAESVAA